MRVFGLTIARTKALPSTQLQAVSGRGGLWPIVRESFPGAWQRNIEVRTDTVLTYSAVYACITLIASDIGKLRIKLVQQDSNGIWTETESPSFSPVLRKPNRYQTRIKFLEQWVTSKLIHGNTYVLKVRDARNVVVGLYVLDPTRVKPLVAPNGDVFYELSRDDLSSLPSERVVVPATEIIHDIMVALHHPLVGVSPIYACGLAATQGIEIQTNVTKLAQNGSNPGGVLTAPGTIDDTTAARLKEHWDNNYTGNNVGKVAVLGDGLKYEAMIIKPVDAQLIEQLKWSAETVCSCFHVPAYMAGVGAPPSYNNIQSLSMQYYQQCLQTHIESIELLLDEGLGLDVSKDGVRYGTELDLDGLLRMDGATQIDVLAKGVGSAIYAPDEARRKLDLKPVPGGAVPYLQEQNYSLEALSKRDAREDPFGKEATAAPPPEEAPAAPANDDGTDDETRALVAQSVLRKELGLLSAA